MILNDLPNSEIRKYIKEFMPYGPVARMLEEYILDSTPVIEMVYNRNEIEEFRELIRKFRLFVEGKEEEAELKRYKVTTEVTFTIRADCEADAIEEADDRIITLEDCEPNGYYEVEEVLD